jgi:hypothetical protein
LVSHIKGNKDLRSLENRMLMRIFGPNRDEVTGCCRKMQKAEFHNLYSSPNIRRMRWAEPVQKI